MHSLISPLTFVPQNCFFFVVENLDNRGKEKDLKGMFTENEFHIHVRNWAGEWRCESLSCPFSFGSEKINQNEMRTTRLDDEMASQVERPSYRRTIHTPFCRQSCH